MDTKTPLIYKKMADVMEDIGKISKDQKNTSQGYKFRGIDDVYNAIHPLFKKHRIFMTTEVIDAKRDVQIRKKPDGSENVLIFTLLTIKQKYFAEDGSFVESTSQGEAMDSADKGSNKAMSAAQKYSIIQTFAIPTVEGSPDSDNDKNPADLADLQKMIDEVLRFTEKQRLIDWANDQKEWQKNKTFVSEVNKQIKKLK